MYVRTPIQIWELCQVSRRRDRTATTKGVGKGTQKSWRLPCLNLALSEHIEAGMLALADEVIE
jgi:hypothetical protein